MINNGRSISLVALLNWLLLGAPAALPGAPNSPAPTRQVLPLEQRLTFKAHLLPADPFSAANQIPEEGGEPGPLKVQRGEVLTLVIVGTPAEGYHTYPMTKRTPEQPEAQISRIKFGDSPYLTPLWPVRESEPELVDEGEVVGVLLEHDHSFTWTQDVVVSPTAQPGLTKLAFNIWAQVCDEGGCYDREENIEIPVEVTDTPALTLPSDVARRLQEKVGPSVEVVQVPGDFADDSDVLSTGGGRKGIWGTIITAIIGGFVSLLTPCVFPMIPITVSFFLKQAETQEHRAVTMASIYSLTIVVVLAAGGMVLLPFLVVISQHWATNFALGALFMVFALSLLGMYDITLPSWLTNMTSSKEGQGGLGGVVFMALTFSIISFACVGPIYGGFLTFEAAGQSGSTNWLQLFLGVVSFSTAFAAPFFVLALFPTLLKSMPRSGSWLNSVKVVMGFIELAAVFKFLRGAELNLRNKSEIFTFDFTLGIWVAIAFCCGMYLLNIFRLPHDHDAPETIGVPRLLFSIFFLAFALYLTPGLFKTSDDRAQKPRGEVYSWVESFLLPEPVKEEEWLINYEQAVAQASQENKPLFIDFTGLG